MRGIVRSQTGRTRREGVSGRGMAKKAARPEERYLKVPNHILNIEDLGQGEKMLLAHIYSFGRKGCWQSNETLGKLFFRKTRTITEWVGKLKKGRHILWRHPKGYYRTLWAKSHPDVKGTDTLLYRDGEISKAEIISGQTGAVPPRRKLPSDCAQNCQVSAQKNVIPLRRKLLPTNNTTSKETTQDTATPTPLPAGGQAPALLADRTAGYIARIEQQKKSFGLSARRRTPELTQAEREQRRQQQKMALLAAAGDDKKSQ